MTQCVANGMLAFTRSGPRGWSAPEETVRSASSISPTIREARSSSASPSGVNCRLRVERSTEAHPEPVLHPRDELADRGRRELKVARRRRETAELDGPDEDFHLTCAIDHDASLKCSFGPTARTAGMEFPPRYTRQL